jgi:hypothetical protein
MKRTAILGASILSLLLSSPALGIGAKPDPRNPQYQMGYSAGRRDERLDLCRRFEKHSSVAESLLGRARIVLIRAFCKSRL